MSVNVRAAQPSDVDDLVDWNAAMALETEDKRLDRAVLRRGVERLLADPAAGTCYVAVDADGAGLGTLSLTREWSDWRAGWFWWIQSVYVRPEARAQGVFTALYRHAESLARAEPDVIGLRLYVERDNTRAQRTYARLGMHETDYRLYEVGFQQAEGPT